MSSGLTSHSSIKIYQATQNRRQNPEINGETTVHCQEQPRDSELYREQKKEKEVKRRRKVRVKREESNQANNQIHK